jgi:protein TonB
LRFGLAAARGAAIFSAGMNDRHSIELLKGGLVTGALGRRSRNAVSSPGKAVYFLLAAGLHAAVLFGVKIAQPTLPVNTPAAGEFMEDAALLSGPADADAPAIEPVAPEVPPPVTPTPEDALVASAVTPAEHPVPDVFTPLPAVVAPPMTAAARPNKTGRAATSGRVGAAHAGAGAGEHAHADWRNRVSPSYPESARAARQTGRVLITVDVSSTGNATSARVSSSSGVRALDEAALAAARASTYNPRVSEGVAMRDTVIVPYSFRLEDR